MASYKKEFAELSEEDLLKIGYENGKDMIELNKSHAKLDNERRKIIHRILQLLKINYVGLSDAQKCFVIYERYKQYLKSK